MIFLPLLEMSGYNFNLANTISQITLIFPTTSFYSEHYQIKKRLIS